MLGGGEAGHEAILPLDRLEGFVRSAVRSENETMGLIMIEQTGRLIDAIGRMIPKDVTIDRNEIVGALLPAVDAGLADRLVHVSRGNVR